MALDYDITNSSEFEVTFAIDPATVITVPIDDTLSIAHEAADAKATGDALALKANLAETVTLVYLANNTATTAETMTYLGI